MNTGWVGPSPLSVLRAVSDTLEEEAHIGAASIRGASFAREILDNTRGNLAGFVGADPDELRITHSTHEGVNTVLYGTDWHPMDELIICDLEHSALVGPAKVLVERRGIRLVQLEIPPSSQQAAIVEIVKSAVGPRTRMVALSHIQFGVGLLMPIKAIARVVHEHGIPFLVDGAQSIGQIAVNVADLECDFYAFSGQKWLLGPVGTGALYVRSSCQDLLEPLFSTHALESSRKHRRPFLDRFGIAAQNFGLIAGLGEAVRIASEIGIQNIEQRVTVLADLLATNVSSIPGLALISSTNPFSSGLVTISFEGWSPSDLVRVLEEDFGIVARVVRKPEGVRFSTAYFNTELEIEQVVVALTQLRAKSNPCSGIT